MKLILDERYEQAIGWNWTLTRLLAQSGLFTVSTRQFAQLTQLPVHRRRENLTLFEIDGKLIALDTWDTHEPTATFRLHGLFKPGALLSDVSLLLKVQYYPGPYWETFTQESGIPVCPWTVMPARDFPLSAFQWRPDNHRWTGTLLGKNNRFGRPSWVEFAKQMPDIFQLDHADKIPMAQYINALSQCRWGIILAGKHRDSDRKNRRESEFTSCGLPLALNYVPNYTFLIKPGIHFFLLTKPSDLLLLRDLDPAPFAEASKELWRTLHSPRGMAANLIMQIQKHCATTT